MKTEFLVYSLFEIVDYRVVSEDWEMRESVILRIGLCVTKAMKLMADTVYR